MANGSTWILFEHNFYGFHGKRISTEVALTTKEMNAF